MKRFSLLNPMSHARPVPAAINLGCGIGITNHSSCGASVYTVKRFGRRQTSSQTDSTEPVSLVTRMMSNTVELSAHNHHALQEELLTEFS